MSVILTTKLQVPPLRSSLVPRPRLIARLNAGRNGKLALVSAPAGYGKTTLVAEWLAQCDPAALKAAWLSLDENDNDPVRFLAHLIAALRQIDPRLGGATLSMLQAPQPPPPEAVITALINDIASLPTPFVLILDDYHVIRELGIHQQLDFLVEHQPPQIHLVIITREDPLLASCPSAGARADGRNPPGGFAFFTGGMRGFSASGDGAESVSCRYRHPWSAAPRAGSPVCSWRPSPCAGAMTCRVSSRLSPAAAITCWII